MWKRLSCLFLLCLALCVTTSAYYEGTYVFDESGTLSEEEAQALDSQAASLGETYNFGVYLIVVNDLNEYGYSDDEAYDCAVQFYEQSDLGFGEDHDGELLFVSMENRKYALVYTGYGDIAFTEYGRDILEEAMLDHLRVDDWYGGFKSYLDESEYLLAEAADGEPLGWDEYGSYHPDDAEDDGPGLFELVITIAVPLVVAFLVCIFFETQLTSVHEAVQANEYAVEGSLNIRTKYDHMTHSTQTRTKISSDSDSGGGSSHHSGGGHSGRSGGF